MSFSLWKDKPPFTFDAKDREQIYQVGAVWVVTDDPKRATQAEVDAVINAPAAPDVSGFVLDVKAAMGGIVASNTLAKAYPLFQPALGNGVWADVQALVIDAHATLVLSDAQYAAIKSLAVKHNIPIALP